MIANPSQEVFVFKLLTSSGSLSNLPADETPLKMGKIAAAGSRRTALGDLTNVNAAAANAKVINHQKRFWLSLLRMTLS